MGIDTTYLLLSPTTTKANIAERRGVLTDILADQFFVGGRGPLHISSYHRWPTAHSQYRAAHNLTEARFIAAEVAPVFPDAVVLAAAEVILQVDSDTVDEMLARGAMLLDDFITQLETWATEHRMEEGTVATMTSLLNPEITIPLSWFRTETHGSFQATFAGHSHTNRFELSEWEIVEH